MRIRWYLLAALAGGLTGLAICLWPQGPVWQSGPNTGESVGFSPDSQILLTLHTADHDDESRWNDPVLRRWDAATGRLLSRATLPCITETNEVRASGDGRTALIGEERPGDPSPIDRDWYVHDGITGERRVGPIPGLASVGKAFSADGRLFYGSLRPADQGSPLTRSLGIFHADTAELLLKAPEEDGLSAIGGRFAPDGATFAYYSLRFEPWPSRPSVIIHIVEFPSGRERRRFEPPVNTRELVSWDGRFLQLREYDFNSPPNKTLNTVRIYDLDEDPIRKGAVDPFLSNEITSYPSLGLIEARGGPDSVAYFSSVAPAPPQAAWVNWITSWLGTQRAAPRGQLVSVRIVDRATGATRYEIPRPLRHPYHVSPDGRWLASLAAGDESVELWDLDPPPRWPKAAGAGLAIAACVLGLGWYRRARAN
jgi:hypothetical protein